MLEISLNLFHIGNSCALILDLCDHSAVYVCIDAVGAELLRPSGGITAASDIFGVQLVRHALTELAAFDSRLFTEGKLLARSLLRKSRRKLRYVTTLTKLGKTDLRSLLNGCEIVIIHSSFILPNELTYLTVRKLLAILHFALHFLCELVIRGKLYSLGSERVANVRAVGLLVVYTLNGVADSVNSHTTTTHQAARDRAAEYVKTERYQMIDNNLF